MVQPDGRIKSYSTHRARVKHMIHNENAPYDDPVESTQFS